MRSGASHPGPHHSCVPVPALSPRRRRHERYSQHLPRGALHMLKLGYRLAIVRSRISNRCGTNSSALPQEQGGGGGRNARATSRAVARFWKFSPRRFALENHRCCLLAAIIRSSQEPSRFAGTQSLPLCCEPQHKRELALCRNCGGTDFLVEDGGKLRIIVGMRDACLRNSMTYTL